ncbi:MAG: hypothetical protein ACK5JO_12280 [Halodesulfovibrio sp.]
MTALGHKTQDESNKPMNWDMWTCFNKKRWEQRAKERAAAPKPAESEALEESNRPMDWDMWKPFRKKH